MIARFFASLRSRPAHERRILAITTYLSASALIIAVWLTSFTKNLGSINTSAAPNNESAAVAASTDLSSQQLVTPFNALKDSLHSIADGIHQFKNQLGALSAEIRAAQHATGTEAIPPNPPENTKPPLLARDTSPHPAPPTTLPSRPRAIPPSRPSPANVAAIASAVPSSDLRESNLEELVVSPALLGNVVGEAQGAHGLWGSIRGSVNTITQTMVNAYRAITE